MPRKSKTKRISPKAQVRLDIFWKKFSKFGMASNRNLIQSFQRALVSKTLTRARITSKNAPECLICASKHAWTWLIVHPFEGGSNSLLNNIHLCYACKPRKLQTYS